MSVPSAANSTTSRAPPKVAIVGAGIGGMSVAIFLRKRGFQVDLYESKSLEALKKLTKIGNGIHLYSHCARMLKEAGLPIEEHLVPQDIEMRRDDGKLMTDISRDVQLNVCPELEATKASVFSVLRQNLYRVLFEATPPEILHCDKYCVGATQNLEQGLVEVKFKDGTSVTSDFLIGADGIHSVLAAELSGPRELKKHGIVVLQGLSEYTRNQGKETWLLQREGGTMGVVPAVLPSGKEGTFWWVTVREADLRDIPDLLDFFTSESSRYSYKLVNEVVNMTVPNSIEQWHSQDKDPLEEQHWSIGRIVLLGDACHAANPFSGYGAGMTIEDAYWLSDALKSPDILVGNPSDLGTALEQYKRKRSGYTAQIVHDSRILMNVLHPPNSFVAGILNAVWSTGLPGPIIARKFIKVFESGLAEMGWTEEEKKEGELAF